MAEPDASLYRTMSLASCALAPLRHVTAAHSLGICSGYVRFHSGWISLHLNCGLKVICDPTPQNEALLEKLRSALRAEM